MAGYISGLVRGVKEEYREKVKNLDLSNQEHKENDTVYDLGFSQGYKVVLFSDPEYISSSDPEEFHTQGSDWISGYKDGLESGYKRLLTELAER